MDDNLQRKEWKRKWESGKIIIASGLMKKRMENNMEKRRDNDNKWINNEKNGT